MPVQENISLKRPNLRAVNANVSSFQLPSKWVANRWGYDSR